MGEKHIIELPDGEEYVADYEEDMQIDQEALDVEWMRHPKMAFAYSVALAEARIIVKEMKREHKVMIAETILDVKKDPEAYGFESKPTVDEVKSAAECDEEVEELYANVVNAEREADILAAAVKAIDDKKSALEHLVKLHGQSYFATPQTDAEGSSMLREKRSTRVKKSSKKKRRKIED